MPWFIPNFWNTARPSLIKSDILSYLYCRRDLTLKCVVLFTYFFRDVRVPWFSLYSCVRTCASARPWVLGFLPLYLVAACKDCIRMKPVVCIIKKTFSLPNLQAQAADRSGQVEWASRSGKVTGGWGEGRVNITGHREIASGYKAPRKSWRECKIILRFFLLSSDIFSERWFNGMALSTLLEMVETCARICLHLESSHWFVSRLNSSNIFVWVFVCFIVHVYTRLLIWISDVIYFSKHKGRIGVFLETPIMDFAYFCMLRFFFW